MTAPCHSHPIHPTACVALTAALLLTAAQPATAQPGWVLSHQKISSTEGGFTGSLDDSDWFGSSVASLGDLDGDGVRDLAVGAFLDDDGGTARGAVWVLFLNADGTVKSHQKISDTAGGFTGTLDDDDIFGYSLAALGDLDGDGVDDLAVGANLDDDGGFNHGAAWVLFLNIDGTVKSHQKISDTAGGFTGILDDDDRFGDSVVSLGDLDGDGVSDMAVGAHRDGDGGPVRGAVWVLFLNRDGTVKSHQKISDTEGGFTGGLDDQDWFGWSLASLGDLDNDGVGDLAVGAIRDDDGGGQARSDRGAVWVLFLNTDGTVKSHQKISDTEGGFTGILDDVDRFGASVAALPDLDGDGTADLAVGAVFDDDGGNGLGAVWVLFLDTDGTVKSHQKISATEGGFTGDLDDFDSFGNSLASLGDLDRDGVSDLAVGAPGDDDGGSSRGAVWMLFLDDTPPIGDTFYVNGDCGNDDWTGTSSACEAPDGPKLTIQAGIDASVDTDTVIVADGIYTGAGNRDLDYAGRLIVVRSENGPQNCIIDCEANDADRHRAFNFHTNETDLAVLDGFTIMNGYRSYGGGIRCANGSSPHIRNCILLDNTAIQSGGGMYSINSSPTVSDCTFSGNFASGGGGMGNSGGSPTVTNCTFSGNAAWSGGGMSNGSSNPTVTGCTFADNTSEFLGGGMRNDGDNPTVSECTFTGNASWSGGGMSNTFSDPTVSGCTFDGNTARVGGGIYNEENSSPTVTHCAFADNTSLHGGGMYNGGGSPTVSDSTFSGNAAADLGGGMLNAFSNLTVTDCTFSMNSASCGGAMCNINNDTTTVTNCVLWNDGAGEIVDDSGATTTVSFSDVQGGWGGQGNIDADPLFCDPANGDYRLSSGSPCIDAADNTAVPKGIETDLDGNPRFVDDPDTPDTGNGDPPIVDMGTYEFQGLCDPCNTDCSADGLVNAFDIEPFLALLFDPDAVPCSPCAGNTDGDPDGNINSFDIEPFLECLFP